MSKNKLSPTNRSENERKKFLNEHFCYEVIMLLNAIGEYAKACKSEGKKKQVYVNLAIEDILVHGRLLREFFYSEDRKKDDDAHPIDFVRDFSRWEAERPKETKNIMKMVERANKEIMHLTYKRHYGTPEKKKWYFGPIATDLCKIVQVFLKHIDKKYWDSPLEQLQADIDSILSETKKKSKPNDIWFGDLGASTASVSTISSVPGSTHIVGIDDSGAGEDAIYVLKENGEIKKRNSFDMK